MAMIFLAAALFIQTGDMPPVSWDVPPVATEHDYPKFAGDLMITGHADVMCDVSEAGIPINCAAITSRPAHMGFDTAAVNIAQRGRLKPPADTSGELQSFRIQVPFTPASDPVQPRPDYSGPQPNPAQFRAARQYISWRTRNMQPAHVRVANQWQIDRMPQDQRDFLRAALERQFPNVNEEREALVLATARLLATREMQTIGRLEPDAEREWFQQVNAMRPSRQPFIDAIRTDYCSRFDCTSGELRAD